MEISSFFEKPDKITINEWEHEHKWATTMHYVIRPLTLAQSANMTSKRNIGAISLVAIGLIVGAGLAVLEAGIRLSALPFALPFMFYNKESLGEDWKLFPASVLASAEMAIHSAICAIRNLKKSFSSPSLPLSYPEKGYGNLEDTFVAKTIALFLKSS